MWGKPVSKAPAVAVLSTLKFCNHVPPAFKPTYHPVQIIGGGSGTTGGGALRGKSAAKAGPTASAVNTTPESNSFLIGNPFCTSGASTPPKKSLENHIRISLPCKRPKRVFLMTTAHFDRA